MCVHTYIVCLYIHIIYIDCEQLNNTVCENCTSKLIAALRAILPTIVESFVLVILAVQSIFPVYLFSVWMCFTQQNALNNLITWITHIIRALLLYYCIHLTMSIELMIKHLYLYYIKTFACDTQRIIQYFNVFTMSRRHVMFWRFYIHMY